MHSNHRQALTVFSLALACLIGLQGYNAYSNFQQSAVLGESATSTAATIIRPNFASCTDSSQCKSRYCDTLSARCLPQPTRATEPTRPPQNNAFISCSLLAAFLDSNCTIVVPTTYAQNTTSTTTSQMPSMEKRVSCTELRRVLNAQCKESLPKPTSSQLSPRPTRTISPLPL